LNCALQLIENKNEFDLFLAHRLLQTYPQGFTIQNGWREGGVRKPKMPPLAINAASELEIKVLPK
jgi:hypothetical protein